MSQLGLGLSDANQHEAALSVREAELSLMRRLGASEHRMLAVQTNLAISYAQLGRTEQALSMRRDVYSATLRLHGEENKDTIQVANNYAASLIELERYAEAKALFRKTIPVARRVLGESEHLTLVMKLHYYSNYAMALYKDDGATPEDLRAAVTTLEDIEGIARRVLGGAHPIATGIQLCLQDARAVLRAREGDDVSSVCEGVAAMMTPGDA